MKKKGQIGNLQGIILVLVIAGILLAAGFFIFDAFQDQVDNTVNTVTYENSSATVGNVFINDTPYTVAEEGATCFNSLVVTEAVNRSGVTPLDIESGNYTVNAGLGTITGGIDVNYTNVSISYTYQSGTSACQGIENTSIAMLTIPELLGLIILIAIIGVILAVIFNVIPGARTQGA